MNPLELKLAEKITTQQELESDIKDNQFRLNYTKYEINNLKDLIITEYQNSLKEKLQKIEDLKNQ